MFVGGSEMTKAEKLIDRRISAAYYATCNGVQIDIFDIGKVFAAGRKAIDAGADDAGLQAAIVAFVATIRKN
jgi:hypothetical protein